MSIISSALFVIGMLSTTLSFAADNSGKTLDTGAVFMGAGASYYPSMHIGTGNVLSGIDFRVAGSDSWKVQIGPQINGALWISGGIFLNLDLSAFAKFSYSFALPKQRSIDLYGKLPIGYSYILAGGGGAGGSNSGLHVGFFPGVAYFLNKRVGLFSEIGFLDRIFRLFREGDAVHSFALSANIGVTINF
ncbi:MAG: hypothetical protein BWZ03_00470 [bacterium ADurb.BinA186]|nr:MAG: hypothetical protein BWZ03_00470 [bacterium ADurb.BinA186]